MSNFHCLITSIQRVSCHAYAIISSTHVLVLKNVKKPHTFCYYVWEYYFDGGFTEIIRSPETTLMFIQYHEINYRNDFKIYGSLSSAICIMVLLLRGHFQIGLQMQITLILE